MTKPDERQELLMDGPPALIRIELFQIIQDPLFSDVQLDRVCLRARYESVPVGDGIAGRSRVMLIRRGLRAQECRDDLVVPIRDVLFRYFLEAAEVMNAVLFRVELKDTVRPDFSLDDDARVDDAIPLDMGAGHDSDFHADPDMIFNDDRRELGRIAHRHRKERAVGIDRAPRSQARIKAERHVF